MQNETYRITANEKGVITHFEMNGDIIGPFGVASKPIGNNWYRLTHLHTGYAIAELASRHRGRSIVAAHVLKAFVPVWTGNDKFIIGALNGMKANDLIHYVRLAAIIAWCEGEPGTNKVG